MTASCIVVRHGVVRIVNQATKRMFNIPERAVSGQTLVEDHPPI
jgi:nitrogen fixation/metabolism regulation signal transduction histidine kinase